MRQHDNNVTSLLFLCLRIQTEILNSSQVVFLFVLNILDSVSDLLLQVIDGQYYIHYVSPVICHFCLLDLQV